MGMVFVTGEIGPNADRVVPVRFLVDTGAFYTFIGPDLAARLGLEFPVPNTAVMADGTRVNAPVGSAFLRIQERQGGILVVLMDVNTPLLGAVSMQALGIKVNPKDETIEFNGIYPTPV